MEKLSELPETKTENTEQESKIMEKYFGKSPQKLTQPTGNSSFRYAAKMGIYITGLYLLVSNTYADSILQLVPMLKEKPLVTYFVKLLIFYILVVCLIKFI